MKNMKNRKIIVVMLMVFVSMSLSAGLFLTQEVFAEPTNTMIIIHYNRPDADYEKWNLWIWEYNQEGEVFHFTGKDEFGVYSIIELEGDISKVGFIVRTDAWEKDVEVDRFIEIKDGFAEIWVNSEQEEFLHDSSANMQAKKQTHEQIQLSIHYDRHDDDYEGWNLWLWREGQEGASFEFADEDEDGKVANITLENMSGIEKIGFVIRRSIEGNDWAEKDIEEDRFIRAIRADAAGNIAIFLRQGVKRISFDADEMLPEPIAQRYIRIKYVREDKDYTGWNIWTWFTGKRDGQIDFEKIVDSAAIANIEIAPETKEIGFKVRKGSDWDSVEVDIGEDRTIKTPICQRLIKVVVTSMQNEFKTLLPVTGPKVEAGSVTFYFRDDVLFYEDKMHTIEFVRVRIFGKEYIMDYIAEDELFTITLEDIPEGKHEYTFLLTKDGLTEEIADSRNVGDDGRSFIENGKAKLKISAHFSLERINYTQNAVLSLNIERDGIEYKAKGIHVDVTALGGSEELYISPLLNAVTIAVRHDIAPGIKTLPITVTDKFGGKHQIDATIEVVERIRGGEVDFSWDEAIIYFMLTDRFKDGNPNNNDPYGNVYDKSKPRTVQGGDFAGITKKLPYLQKLGVNTIWITPIIENIQFDVRHKHPGSPQYAYHGYWPLNFERLNPHLGTIQELHELIDAANEKGMKIMADVILNHTGYGLMENDPRIEGAIKNFPSPKDHERFSGMLRLDPVHGCPIRGELAGLPDFITEDPEVRNQLIKWNVAWIEKARTDKGNTIDFFRIDTVKHVDDVTWMAFRNELARISPEFKIIGEAFGAHARKDMGYLGSGMMDSLLDFNFDDLARGFVGGEIEVAQAHLKARNATLNSAATAGQFLGSHDERGFLTSVEYDRGKLKIAASLQMTAKGQPVIYYREEIGLSGELDFPHYHNRGNMPWEEIIEGNEKYSMLTHYRKITNARKRHLTVLTRGNREVIGGSDEAGYTVFKRSYNDEHIIVALNVEDVSKEININMPFESGTKLVDEYSRLEYIVDHNQQVSLKLPKRLEGGTVILAKIMPVASISMLTKGFLGVLVIAMIAMLYYLFKKRNCC
ncbi:MAG: pullulanase-associated domain-containing protein [Alkaliphilus sp.]